MCNCDELTFNGLTIDVEIYLLAVECGYVFAIEVIKIKLYTILPWRDIRILTSVVIFRVLLLLFFSDRFAWLSLILAPFFLCHIQFHIFEINKYTFFSV